MSAKFFLFDCETTGLSEENHTLLTIFGLALNKNLDVIDTIDLKIKPKNGIYHVDPVALEINKIDLAEHSKTSISKQAAALGLVGFLKASRYKDVHGLEDFPLQNDFPHLAGINPSERYVPVGKNVGFDIKFLKKLLGEDEYYKLFSNRVLDISSVVHFQKLCGILPEDLGEALPDLAKYFGISSKGLHDAEFDAILTLEVLKRLIQNNETTKGN